MAEQPGPPADDAYRGRRPTSHERRAGQRWDASYVDGPAPWDTGRPQPAIVRLAGSGAFAGAVLDAGVRHAAGRPAVRAVLRRRRSRDARLASGRRADLTAAFGRASGWSLASVRAEQIETRFSAHGVPGWLASAERIEVDRRLLSAP